MSTMEQIQSFEDIASFLPKSWALVKNRSIFKERNDRNGEDDSELLSVTQNQGVIRQSDYEIKKDTSNDDKTNYKKVEVGDIVYNKMRMWQGAVGLSEFSGIVSPAYIILRPIQKIEPRYFYYLMKTPAYIAQSYSYSYGLCDDMNSLRYEDFRNMLSILPPLEEQKKIVSFLDKKCANINHFIENKKAYINKLNERKQVTINTAVTKGIGNHICLRSDDISWLEEVPKNWSVKKLKYIVRLRNEISYSHKDSLKLALENIEGFTGKYLPSENSFEGVGSCFCQGDVLFGKLRPYLCKVFIAESDGECVSDILPITPDRNFITADYLFYRLLSIDFIKEVNSSTYGAKMPRASWKFIGNLKLPIPSLAEQKQITDYLKKEIKIIDKAIMKAEQQIELIKEYKVSLISDVVAGQLEIKD